MSKSMVLSVVEAGFHSALAICTLQSKHTADTT